MIGLRKMLLSIENWVQSENNIGSLESPMILFELKKLTDLLISSF